MIRPRKTIATCGWCGATATTRDEDGDPACADHATADGWVRCGGKRVRHVVLWQGRATPAVDVARACGISVSNYRVRLARGDTPLDAATAQRPPAAGVVKYRAPDGRRWVDVAATNGVPRPTFYQRVKRGTAPRLAAETPPRSRRRRPVHLPATEAA